jgi:hypothetical protein
MLKRDNAILKLPMDTQDNIMDNKYHHLQKLNPPNSKNKPVEEHLSESGDLVIIDLNI